MTTPVQTWGALGSMVQEQKEYGATANQYLENYEIHDLFANLLKQVLVEQPANPLKFLQEVLQKQTRLCLCVVGPPGINRTKYCQQLATEYKLKHVHVGKLLREKKDLAKIIESGELVEDEIVIPLVKEELMRAKNTGWVLDGYPRTKVQAQALEAAGKAVSASLDTVIMLQSNEATIRECYAAKVASAGFDVAEKQDLIETRLQQYKRHVLTLCEVFQNVARPVQVTGVDDDQSLVYNNITSCMHYRGYSNAPLRMHRICIIGACSSGRSTQCELVAKEFGVVHVDLADLLRRKLEAQGQAPTETPPEYLSDEEACALIGERLRQTDCVRKGWVLDGFPKTKAQAEFLRQAHLWPSRVIRLQVQEASIVNRNAARRLDPVTCQPYYTSPNSIVVRQRLIQNEYDMPEKVKMRYAMFNDGAEGVGDCWRSVYSKVPAEDDAEGVFNGVTDKIKQALPVELAQDPNSGL